MEGMRLWVEGKLGLMVFDNDCTQCAKGSWEPRRTMCLHTLTALIHTHSLHS